MLLYQWSTITCLQWATGIESASYARDVSWHASYCRKKNDIFFKAKISSWLKGKHILPLLDNIIISMLPLSWYGRLEFKFSSSNCIKITHHIVSLCASLNSNSAPQKSLYAPVKTATNNNSGFGALKSGFFQKNQVAKSVTSTGLSAATLEEVASPSGAVQTVEDYVKAKGGDRVIRKVLIANNGMAATKSIMSMRQWAYMT